MSLTFGVGSSGFVMPDYSAYNNYLKQTLIEQIPNIELTSGSINNIILELFTNASYQMLEALENLYYQLFPSTATGVNLDRIVSFANLIRMSATYSTVKMIFTGNISSFVPSGTIVTDENYQFRFVNDESFTLSGNECYSALVQIQLVSGQDYDLSINGLYIGIKNTTLSSTADIISQIKINFNANELSDELIFNTIDDENFSIQAKDISISFSISLNSQVFAIENISAVKTFTSTAIGQIYVNANVLTILENSISGITSVTNPLNAMPGTNVETDIELRKRFFSVGQNSRTYATFSAIVSSFQNINLIQNILYVNVIENRKDVIDSNNLPPHSICLIVLGGDNDSIANLLWQTAPAGIGFYGNTSVSITDSLGHPQLIHFTRPVAVYVFIKIQAIAQAGYTISASDRQNIITNVMKYGSGLKPGQNVIIALVSAFAMLGASEILDNVIVQIGFNTDLNVAPSNFNTIDIPISIFEMAIFNEGNILFV